MGPKIQEAFTDMGVIAWADTDIDAAMAEDEQVAEQIDREQDARLRHVQAVANTRSGRMRVTSAAGRGGGHCAAPA